MSWGSGAAEGASNAGSAASSAGSAGSAASSMPSSVSGYSTQAPSGFSMDASAAANQGQGPTIAAGNMQTYGTETPSMMQQAGNTVERFQKGQGQTMSQAVDKFGNNAETYGYLYDKANKLSGMGKQGGGAVPITINNTNQQPVNPYLQARLRRY